MWPLQHTDGGWRLAEAAEREGDRESRAGQSGGDRGSGWVVGGDAIAFARCWGPSGNGSGLSKPARQPVISKMLGATDPHVAQGAKLECDAPRGHRWMLAEG